MNLSAFNFLAPVTCNFKNVPQFLFIIYRSRIYWPPLCFRLSFLYRSPCLCYLPAALFFVYGNVTPLPSSISFVSATSFSGSPTKPLLTVFPSASFHSAFVISGRTGFTFRRFSLFFQGHQAQWAVNRRHPPPVAFPFPPCTHTSVFYRQREHPLNKSQDFSSTTFDNFSLKN